MYRTSPLGPTPGPHGPPPTPDERFPGPSRRWRAAGRRAATPGPGGVSRSSLTGLFRALHLSGKPNWKTGPTNNTSTSWVSNRFATILYPSWDPPCKWRESPSKNDRSFSRDVHIYAQNSNTKLELQTYTPQYLVWGGPCH